MYFYKEHNIRVCIGFFRRVHTAQTVGEQNESRVPGLDPHNFSLYLHLPSSLFLTIFEYVL